MRKLVIFAAALAILMALPASSAAVSYKVTVHTGSAAYVGPATVAFSGQVYPAPGPNTWVYVRVFNPDMVLVTAVQSSVNGTTGLYSGSFVAGGSSSWTDGNYVVNATWGAYGSPTFGVASFTWSSSATTSTTTSASATSSTQSTSSESSTKSSSSSTAAGGIPEFPFQALGVVATLVVVVGAYIFLVRGRAKGTRRQGPTGF